jgi:uncharacterized protein YijF (DUF1287 family)
MDKKTIIPITTVILILIIACRQNGPAEASRPPQAVSPQAISIESSQVTEIDSPTLKQVIESALAQTKQTVGYDPAYVRIDYPGGDVPINTGVCSDVVVRSLRRAGVDLQKEVHEDMKRNFSAYPNSWGLARPDPNIDHRRVPNLMTYFKRMGKSLDISSVAKDYLPGDVIAWRLDNGLLHIGIVSNVRAGNTERHTVVHNIGAGAQLEDVLFAWRIIGHYRYF